MTTRRCIVGVLLVVLGGMTADAYRDQPSDELLKVQALVDEWERQLEQFDSDSAAGRNQREALEVRLNRAKKQLEQLRTQEQHAPEIERLVSLIAKLEKRWRDASGATEKDRAKRSDLDAQLAKLKDNLHTLLRQGPPKVQQENVTRFQEGLEVMEQLVRKNDAIRRVSQPGQANDTSNRSRLCRFRLADKSQPGNSRGVLDMVIGEVVLLDGREWSEVRNPAVAKEPFDYSPRIPPTPRIQSR